METITLEDGFNLGTFKVDLQRVTLPSKRKQESEIVNAARTLFNFVEDHPSFVFSIISEDARTKGINPDDPKAFHDSIVAEHFVVLMFLHRFIQSMDSITFNILCSGMVGFAPPETESEDERKLREERAGIMSNLGIASASTEGLELTVRIIKEYAKRKQLPNAYRTLSDEDAATINDVLREGFGRTSDQTTTKYILEAIKLRDDYASKGSVPDWEPIYQTIFAKYGKPRTKNGLRSQVSRYESAQRKTA